ncbi:MAG TPA: POTRA domain-containing protein [Thermoguttaceae bacterium]|nr:POTRA domain-containing protein [Thermoguttaceae bacterium]
MATRPTGPDCRPSALFMVLLSLVALSGSLACHQTPVVPRPTGWGSAVAPRGAEQASTGARAGQATIARGQTPSGPVLPDLATPRPSPEAAPEPQVVDVRIAGPPRQTPDAEILRQIHTRPGRPYDPEQIEDDVRRLSRTRKFVEVNPRYQDVPGGRIVIFEVLERPVLRHVKYVGNEKIAKKKLNDESGIKPGDAMDPFAIEEGRRRIEEYYRGKGFSQVRVTIFEGTKTSDRGATYVINEGPKKRVLWTQFIGNTIAGEAKLRTKIQSKPGIFWIFNGELNRKKLEEDKERLTDYYRGLGYFRAKVSVLPPDPAKSWQLLTFVIDEGPRYAVRNVSFVGSAKIPAEELAEDLKLKGGEFFNQAQMRTDRAAIRDKYGAIGHIFADVEPDLRFFPEPGQIDIVYNIQEGEPYRVGRIDVDILGENPHTRISTVLNRLSLAPGDLVDVRELRASERRLKASGLFEYDPMKGVVPQIVVRPPELEDVETGIARKPRAQPRPRGQSPDPVPHQAFRLPYPADPSATDESGPPRERVVNLCVQGGRAAALVPVQYRVARPPSRDPSRSTADSEIVIRGQYSADAGQTIPPLRRPEPQPPTQPAPPYGAYVPPAQTSPQPTYPAPSYPAPSYSAPSYPPAGGSGYATPASPPPTGSSYSVPDYSSPGGSAVYDRSAQSASAPPVPGGSPAPVSPTYGNQFPAGPAAAPGGYDPSGMFPLGGPTINDASPLLGNPPSEDPPLFVPLNPEVYETRTGRLMFSVGVNSDAGLLGSVIVDEQNFDIFRFPRSLEEIRRGVAWRGAGQRFRLEAVPGTQVQKYTAHFQEPYLFDTRVSLGLSGFFYNRWYREWDEERVGGRVSLGYQFTHDLSGTLSFRGEKIQIYDPIQPTPDELTDVLGSNALYGFRGQIAHDTRDNTFLATEGHYFEIGVEQVVGSFTYTRGDIDLRKYFLLRQHPDGSGRHVLSLNFRGSLSSEDTPIYEHYYAGGFSTIRGFDFRGASHRDPTNDVIVGGEFLMLASVEYMFPITADDNIRAVVFCDSGTNEPTIDNWTDNYRVAPGVGLRLVIPAMGPAPIALDFAFPVSKERGDEDEVFSFFIGFLR